MRVLRLALTGFCAVLLAGLIAPAAMSQTDPVRALVVTNLGEGDGIVTIMEAEGWEVTASDVEDLDWVDLPRDIL